MIYLYSGTPGSGKSYHAVADIRAKLARKSKNRVIANFPLGVSSDLFEYWDNSDICIASLVAYAQQHHVRGVEGQCLLVIDEAQCIFNSRDWNGKGIIHGALKRDPDSRMDWIKFFSQHRKLGFNIILIAQSDKMLDKQIRALIEYDVKHIKMNNGFFFFLPTSFLAVEKWYGQHMTLGRQVIWYRRRIAALYDSYAMFDTLAGSDGAQGEPRSGGSPRAACVPPAQAPDAQAAADAASAADVACRDDGLNGTISCVNSELTQDVVCTAEGHGVGAGFSGLSAHFGPDITVTGTRCESAAARIMTAARRRWNSCRAWLSARGGRCGHEDAAGSEDGPRPNQPYTGEG